jgi:thymidylate kinase
VGSPSRSGARPRGAFVVLVGPDGVGKTTVAKAMSAAYSGSTAYFHFIPPCGRLAATAPEHPVQQRPVISPRGSRLLGVCRLLRNVVRCWAGYLTAVRPARRRGALVVGDRWVYGYIAQPGALRFYGPARLAAAAIGLLPRPDLVANLSASPQVVRSRKPELTPAEIAAELAAWSQLPHCRLKTFDATQAPATIAARIFEEL